MENNEKTKKKEGAFEIPKESVDRYHFLRWDAIRSTKGRRERLIKLEKAMKLGNTTHDKVKIYFKTVDEQVLSIEGTVWAVGTSGGDSYVSLKGGKTIPVKSIIDVEFEV
ncbi:hypothetical protein [Xanthovirga aplysinae]|uniref:hypothetical protein n=1 Tax=Xanthovirga aplysinae TaxID=2529853 RepID=UPI0012BBCD33|nr:hypothetical protein [Xanthovirga aplysinae]MTI33063.1 hypothetical protein [Xanthovirga aplysinae]